MLPIYQDCYSPWAMLAGMGEGRSVGQISLEHRYTSLIFSSNTRLDHPKNIPKQIRSSLSKQLIDKDASNAVRHLPWCSSL